MLHHIWSNQMLFYPVLYPNLIHVTSLAHGLNRVAEKVRDMFPNVNKLVNNIKKIFLKAPSRVEVIEK